MKSLLLFVNLKHLSRSNHIIQYPTPNNIDIRTLSVTNSCSMNVMTKNSKIQFIYMSAFLRTSRSLSI